MSGNPFQSPCERETSEPGRETRVQTGPRPLRILRVEPGGTLPPRCVRCNSSEDLTTQTFYFTRGFRRATVMGSLCGRHRRSLSRQTLASLTVLGPAAVLIVMSGLSSSPQFSRVLLSCGVLVALFSLTSAYRWRFGLLAWRIQPEEVQILGAGEEFLNSLPHEPTTE